MRSRPGESRRRGAVAGVVLALLGVLCIAAIAFLIVVRLERRQVVVARANGGPAQATRVAGAPGPPIATAQGRDEQGREQPSASTEFDGCPSEGDGGDRALNRLKNRDVASSLRDTPFDSVLDLPVPTEIGERRRASWPKRAATLVASMERRAVRVEAYVARARLSGPESTNCHGDASRYRDYHIWLTAAPTTDRARSVIAEMTPRLRARHPGWTVGRLSDVARRGDRVRVGGWLLLDQEHPEQIGRTRGTIWEIHPVTSFEVRRDGRWIPLDALPTRGGGR